MSLNPTVTRMIRFVQKNSSSISFFQDPIKTKYCAWTYWQQLSLRTSYSFFIEKLYFADNASINFSWEVGN